jgi:hypothetical protein
MADNMPIVDIASTYHECAIVKCFHRNACLRLYDISREIETLGFTIKHFNVHPKENTYGIKLLSAIHWRYHTIEDMRFSGNILQWHTRDTVRQYLLWAYDQPY